MNQRIYNLSKWARVPEGTAMPFPSPRKRRNVVLEVNCPQPVSLYILQHREDVADNPEKRRDFDAGRPSRTSLPGVEPEQLPDDIMWKDRDGSLVASFLCACGAGRDTIDFAVDGPFSIIADGGEVHVYSQDSQQVELHVPAPEIFTRIANRRARNPQFELMMWQQRQNMEQRFADLVAESERRIIAAQEGAKARYAPPRQLKSAIAGRYGEEPDTEGQGLSSSAYRDDVRARREDTAESAGRGGMAEDEDVSSPAPKPRGKAKSPA